MKQASHQTLARLAVPIFLLLAVSVTALKTVHAQANEYCPVTTSEKANPNIYLDYEGKRIHFCCQKCKRDFLTNPDEYLDNLKVSTVEPTADKPAHSALDAEPVPAKAAELDDGHDHDHDHGESDMDSSDATSGTFQTDDHSDADESSNQTHGSAPDSDHDHATDHGESTNIVGFLGKFHPVVVHFPIALVIMALIFTGTPLVLNAEIFDQMAAITIYWAAFFAVVAALLGLARSAGANFPTTLEEYFEWHRLLGLASAVLTVLTAMVAYYWRKEASHRGRLLFRLLLVLNVIAIGVTGHLGATLVFRPNYYG